MTDTLQISTGEKRIPITRDGVSVGEIVFNPNDAVFAEKFYQLIAEFRETLTQYQNRAAELESNTSTDENDMPVNMGERLTLLKEVCDFVKVKIDSLFGPGTSAMVFGDTMNPDSFIQFFEGMTPFIQKARAQKVAQYTTPRKPKRNGKHSR